MKSRLTVISVTGLSLAIFLYKQYEFTDNHQRDRTPCGSVPKTKIKGRSLVSVVTPTTNW